MALRLDHFDILDSLPGPGTERDPHRLLRCKLPVARSGPWEVRRVEVRKDIALLRSMRDGRGTVPGWYTQLVHDNRGIVMSDTDAEIGDHEKLFERARGRVLIHGLGLGIALTGVLLEPRVTHVDVVEIDADILGLVSPHFSDSRINFHHADCRRKRWGKGIKWDVVWHDIWDEICGDNADEMNELRERFRRRCKWQGCWAEDLACVS